MTDLQRLYRELVSLENELRTGLRRRLRAEHDLSLTSFDVLHLLLRRPGPRIQDVAAEFALTVGGASKIVDRLERAGLCLRRPNPDDRRSAVVHLTPKGRKRAALALDLVEEELRLRLGPALPEEALRELTDRLGALRAANRAAEETRGAAARRPLG